MKIEYIEREKLIELSEIKIGECFETHGRVFIKTVVINENRVECVDLSNGYIVCLVVSYLVKPVNAKLVIGDDDDEEDEQ